MQFGRGKPSVGAFFDSDFTSIDSLLALAVLYGLQGKNDCRVAVTITSRPDLATVGFIDAVERYYRGPARNFAQLTPVGMRTEGKAGETLPAFVAPFATKKYTNQVKSVIDTGDPNTLLRNYLLAQSDQNAFFLLAGPATDLAAALEFRGMKELLKSKIKYLVMAGPQTDVAAAKKVAAEWPTAIIDVPQEIAQELAFPGASIDKEFAANSTENPIADAYRTWSPELKNTPMWATAAALYAGRPKEGYFKVEHQKLVCDPEHRDKVVQAVVELASAKPVIRMRFRPDAVDEKKADIVEK
jgi:hypothetical protein